MTNEITLNFLHLYLKWLWYEVYFTNTSLMGNLFTSILRSQSQGSGMQQFFAAGAFKSRPSYSLCISSSSNHLHSPGRGTDVTFNIDAMLIRWRLTTWKRCLFAMRLIWWCLPSRMTTTTSIHHPRLYRPLLRLSSLYLRIIFTFALPQWNTSLFWKEKSFVSLNTASLAL